MHPALLATLLLAALASAQSAPRLLADLDARPVPRPIASSDPTDFARVGAWTYSDHGRELFRTNGTAQGTALFAALFPGPIGSTPRLLTAAGTQLFFVAEDGIDGPQPFVSDGSAGGTRRIPGFGTPGTSYQSVGVLGSRWVLLAGLPGAQTLWVTDGSAAGTSPIVEQADLEEGEQLSGYGSSSPALIASGGATPLCHFRSAISSLAPGYLWRTDGTRAGTLRVALPVGGSVVLLGVVNDRALVLASQWILPTTRRDYLYAWDGAGPPQLLLGPTGWTGGINATVAVFDGRAWIWYGIANAFVLVTDGSQVGTRVLPQSQYGVSLHVTASLGVSGNALWLAAGSRLFRVDPGILDPTPAGTSPIDLSSAQIGPQFGSRRVVLLGDRRLRVLDPSSRTATDLGVQIPGAGNVEFGEGFGRAYFAHDDGIVGSEPWFTDGTLGGTRLLADLAQSPLRTQDSFPSRFWALAGGMAFVAGDGQNQDFALWLSDGTAVGTRRITGGLSLWGFAVSAGGQFFAQILDPSIGYGLLVTDGTPAGTRRLPAPGIELVSASPIVLGREILFAGTKSRRSALFASDGVTVRYVRDFPAGVVPSNFVQLGESVVFTAGPWQGPHELWSSDGTESGTRSLQGFARITGMARWWNRVWFVAQSLSATGPLELWFTNGSTAGTGPYARLPISAGDPRLFSTRQRLFALWTFAIYVWDGTATSPVSLGLRGHTADASGARVLGERLVFECRGSSTGGTAYSLWSSDGSAAGTIPITPPIGRESSQTPTKLTPIGARHALFKARDSNGRTSTWITDGTASGTRVFSDLVLIDGLSPQSEPSLNAANGLAYVAMLDPVAGIEPHVIELDSSVEPLSRGCGGLGREAELFASLGPAPLGGLSVEGRSSAGSMALVFMSAPPLRPTPLPSAGRCILDVDPNAYVVLLQTPLTNGRFTRSWPLPADAALRGVQATLQAAVAPTNARLGFDLSNGLLVNLWR
ncbi:MAG: hypothetical protein HZB39_02360 [Planctomycetes bacterium]|nr:hypothetical protein [Planctomycetota bacterium]